MLQARRVIVNRDRAGEADEVAAAKDRIIAEAQSRFPGGCCKAPI
jgi:hypothetical protein